MSKAFTRDEAAAAPVVIPARAPLPPGVANYVTPRGLALLRKELARRQAERMQAEASAGHADRAADRVEARAEARAALAVSDASLAELAARIASAIVVDPAARPVNQAAAQPQDEVRFGAYVTVRTEAGVLRTYQLVGVDEADATHGLVAFISPLARALLGRRVGEVVAHKTPRGEEELELVAVRYDASPPPPDP